MSDTARLHVARPIQLLACEFLLSADSPLVLERLERLRPSAVQDHPITRRHQIAVRQRADTYEVYEDDADGEIVGNLDDAVVHVDRRLHELAIDGLAGYTKLHAGCGNWYGRRFLVIGPKGAGKSTLMTRLLCEDCAIEGDEMVLLSDGQAVAYPRRFGIRQLTLRLVPQVGSLVPHLLDRPGADTPGGYHVLALDPVQLGVEWRITTAPIDTLFYLLPRQHGPTRVTACPPQSMAQHVMAESAPPIDGSRTWVRDVGALVRTAQTYEVAVGDLDSAVYCMRQCFLAR